MAGSRDVNLAELFRLWHTPMKNVELCKHFGITSGSLWALRKKHGLPIRPRESRDDTNRRSDDPTPEEIAERAAWCRSQRTVQERARMERDGRVGWEMPAYSFNGRDCSFSGVPH